MPTRQPGPSSLFPAGQERQQYQPHWGEYSSVANLPNGSANALAAKNFFLQVGDLAYVTGSGTYQCTSPGTAGGADATWSTLVPTPAVSPVLWKWNETDTSQFTITQNSLNSVALSRVLNTWGPVLQFDIQLKTGDTGALVVITDAAFVIPTDANNVRRYIMRYRVVSNPTVSPGGGFGPAFACSRSSGANAFGVSGCPAWGGNFSYPARVQAGTFKTTGSTTPGGPTYAPLNPSGGQLINVECEVVMRPAPDASSPPGFRCSTTHVIGGATGTGGQIVSDSALYATAGYLGAFAGWNVTLDSAGFAIASVSSTTTYSVQIDQLEVLRHPMDL